jgi:hemoglobin
MHETSLYERLGGEAGIPKLVDAIVTEHMENPLIRARFLPYASQPEKLALIKKHLVQFLTTGSGGPQRYEGKSMPDAHRGMNIQPAEYMSAVDDILKVLERRGIDQPTRNDVLAIAYSLKGDILQL